MTKRLLAAVAFAAVLTGGSIVSAGSDNHAPASGDHAAEGKATSSILNRLRVAEKTDGKSAPAAHGGGHWTYDGASGPGNWGDLSADYSACKSGRMQSPIDFRGGFAAKPEPIEFDYHLTPLRIVNNGHTIQVNYAPGSGITIGGKRYELLQFHFHSPSEHTIDAKQSAMELHFVHKAHDGELAVVSVMMNIGDANLALSEIWPHIPAQAGAEKLVPGVLINGRDLLPAGRDYYRYMGSLTTPPCSEGVNWHVMVEPVSVDSRQVASFLSVIGENARPVQPQYSRLIVNPQAGTATR